MGSEPMILIYFNYAQQRFQFETPSDPIADDIVFTMDQVTLQNVFNELYTRYLSDRLDGWLRITIQAPTTGS